MTLQGPSTPTSARRVIGTAASRVGDAGNTAKARPRPGDNRTEDANRLAKPSRPSYSDSLAESVDLDDDALGNDIICPICNETMVTLLQLNRHLDDVHSEVKFVDNEDTASWFLKQVAKSRAKQLQSVTSVFTQAFGKLELFEAPDASPDGTSTPPNNGYSNNNNNNNNNKPGSPVPVLTDEHVTRKHWQRSSTPNEKCSEVLCEKPLSARNGCINCRKCGKLFCHQHTLYRMKLTRSAKHDPANGIWCRVCETCYKSRPGYNDHAGVLIDLTQDFKQIRQSRIDQRELEVNRLEKRLVKLITALSSEKTNQDPASIWSFSRLRQKQDIDKQIVKWQRDDEVNECPECLNPFNFALRKHHCRVCGKVVCGNLNTDCSRDVEIDLLAAKLESRPLPENSSNSVRTRICKSCKNTVLSRKNFIQDITAPLPPLLKKYELLCHFRTAIESMLPKFQKTLDNLKDTQNKPLNREVTKEATKIRKKLLDTFAQYDSTSRSLSKLALNTEDERRLQQQIYSAAVQFLQINMLPLRALPRLLKGANKQPNADSTKTIPSGTISMSDLVALPSRLTDTEIADLRQQLVVMEEQKFLVSSMVEEATQRRKYDEIPPLQMSLRELDNEIDRLRGDLGSEAFE